MSSYFELLATLSTAQGDLDALTQKAESMGRRVADVTPDGHCQFAALSHQIYGNEDQKFEIRARVAAWLKERGNFVLENDSRLCEFTTVPWDKYIANLEGTEWGDHLSLIAAAEVLKVAIRVVSSTSTQIVPINPSVPATTLPIFLGHIHERHYVSLPLENKQADGEQKAEKVWSKAKPFVKGFDAGYLGEVLHEVKLQLSTYDDDAEPVAWKAAWKEIADISIPNTLIGVFGTSGAGKSTLINQLLGEQVLPSFPHRATTSALIEISHANCENFTATIQFIEATDWENWKVTLMDELQSGELVNRMNARDILHLLTEGKDKGYADKDVVREHLNNGYQVLVNGDIKQIYQSLSQFTASSKPVDDSHDSNSDSSDSSESESSHSESSDASTFALWPLVQYVSIQGPFKKLPAGISLLDVPGCREYNKFRQALYEKAQKHCHFKLLVAASDRPFDDTEMKSMIHYAYATGSESKFAIVITKLDTHEGSIKSTKSRLRKTWRATHRDTVKSLGIPEDHPKIKCFFVAREHPQGYAKLWQYLSTELASTYSQAWQNIYIMTQELKKAVKSSVGLKSCSLAELELKIQNGAQLTTDQQTITKALDNAAAEAPSSPLNLPDWPHFLTWKAFLSNNGSWQPQNGVFFSFNHRLFDNFIQHTKGFISSYFKNLREAIKTLATFVQNIIADHVESPWNNAMKQQIELKKNDLLVQLEQIQLHLDSKSTEAVRTKLSDTYVQLLNINGKGAVQEIKNGLLQAVVVNTAYKTIATVLKAEIDVLQQGITAELRRWPTSIVNFLTINSNKVSLEVASILDQLDLVLPEQQPTNLNVPELDNPFSSFGPPIITQLKRAPLPTHAQKLKGFLYISSAAGSQRNIWKVGYVSERAVTLRMQELSKETGVPGRYSAAASWIVQDFMAAEALAHWLLNDFTFQTGREHFQAPFALIYSLCLKASDFINSLPEGTEAQYKAWRKQIRPLSKKRNQQKKYAVQKDNY